MDEKGIELGTYVEHQLGILTGIVILLISQGKCVEEVDPVRFTLPVCCFGDSNVARGEGGECPLENLHMGSRTPRTRHGHHHRDRILVHFTRHVDVLLGLETVDQGSDHRGHLVRAELQCEQSRAHKREHSPKIRLKPKKTNFLRCICSDFQLGRLYDACHQLVFQHYIVPVLLPQIKRHGQFVCDPGQVFRRSVLLIQGEATLIYTGFGTCSDEFVALLEVDRRTSKGGYLGELLHGTLDLGELSRRLFVDEFADDSLDGQWLNGGDPSGTNNIGLPSVLPSYLVLLAVGTPRIKKDGSPQQLVHGICVPDLVYHQKLDRLRSEQENFSPEDG